jgi:hypothetical protein
VVRAAAIAPEPDTYSLNLAGTQLQRVSNAMFEFGLTPGLAKPYQVAGLTRS